MRLRKVYRARHTFQMYSIGQDMSVRFLVLLKQLPIYRSEIILQPYPKTGHEGQRIGILSLCLGQVFLFE